MILVGYIFKEICKNQLIILILLFLVCFCQKLMKMIGLDSNFSVYLIFLCLVLNIPELVKLILPFSLFLSVLITCYRLHMNNEVLAMYSCSVSTYIFIQGVFYYSFIIFILSIINISWLSPYCELYRNNMLFEAKRNTRFIKLIEKKFQFLSDKKLVFFVNRVNNMILQDIFIIQNKNTCANVISIMTADLGSLYIDLNNFQSIILKSGIYYEIHHNHKTFTNIFLTDFEQYHAIIDPDVGLLCKSNKSVEHMFINQLIRSENLEAYLELNWRLTLLLSIFIMPIIALLLMLRISENYLFNFLLALVLYIFFFALHILLRSHAIFDERNSIIFMWGINVIYFIVLLIINKCKFYHLKLFNIFMYVYVINSLCILF